MSGKAKECSEREREKREKDNGEWRSERGGEPQRRRSGRAPCSTRLEEAGSDTLLLSLSLALALLILFLFFLCALICSLSVSRSYELASLHNSVEFSEFSANFLCEALALRSVIVVFHFNSLNCRGFFERWR